MSEHNVSVRNFVKTPHGLIRQIYETQKSSSKDRGHEPPAANYWGNKMQVVLDEAQGLKKVRT